jgi:hypothetical protein
MRNNCRHTMERLSRATVEYDAVTGSFTFTFSDKGGDIVIDHVKPNVVSQMARQIAAQLPLAQNDQREHSAAVPEDALYLRHPPQHLVEEN